MGSELLELLERHGLTQHQDSAGAAIGFIFTAQSAPRYFEGLYFAVGMTGLSTVLSAIMVIG